MLYSITQTVICESGFHNVFLGGDVNMNFQDQIQQIFGTTDIHELKQISRDADNYRCLNADMNNSIISEKKKNTGRKNSFTEEQLAHILALQDRGEKITDIEATITAHPNTNGKHIIVKKGKKNYFLLKVSSEI